MASLRVVDTLVLVAQETPEGEPFSLIANPLLSGTLSNALRLIPVREFHDNDLADFAS